MMAYNKPKLVASLDRMVELCVMVFCEVKS